LAAADLKRNGIGHEINPEIAFEALKSLNGKAIPSHSDQGTAM